MHQSACHATRQRSPHRNVGSCQKGSITMAPQKQGSADKSASPSQLSSTLAYLTALVLTTFNQAQVKLLGAHYTSTFLIWYRSMGVAVFSAIVLTIHLAVMARRKGRHALRTAFAVSPSSLFE